MPSEEGLAQPWRSFFDDLDELIREPVHLHCFGGFALIHAFQRLARAGHLSAHVLRERYQNELRPSLLTREGWHDQTLELWIESYFAT